MLTRKFQIHTVKEEKQTSLGQIRKARNLRNSMNNADILSNCPKHIIKLNINRHSNYLGIAKLYKGISQ